MRFLLYTSILLLTSCGGPYKKMERVKGDNSCIRQFKPLISRALYKTNIEVIGKHLSGLLLIKSMPDSSIRVVFSSEMGFSFFDFGFFPDNSFKVYHIIEQMNKKPLIKTLRKDFELLFFKNIQYEKGFISFSKGNYYYGFPQTKGINYYITDSGCFHLIKMQRASAKKPVVEAQTFGTDGNAPDSIAINHLNFNFSISLKKISQ